MELMRTLGGAATGLLIIGLTACPKPAEPAPAAAEEPIVEYAPPEDPEAADGLDVWFRMVDLNDLTDQHLPDYLEDEAGDSELLVRTFPDAPPQIPHSVEDMLPIKQRENECLDCHHPDNTLSDKDAPLSDTHFSQPVVVEAVGDAAMVTTVTGYVAGDDLNGARFNCVMCHTPQAQNVASPDGFGVVSIDPI